MKKAQSKGSLEGESLNSTLSIREGTTGIVLLEQDLVGEYSPPKWGRIGRHPRWREWHDRMLRALQRCKRCFCGETLWGLLLYKN